MPDVMLPGQERFVAPIAQTPLEATGTVAFAPGGEFAAGDQVVTMMGGMGRAFDGGYAEYVVVRAEQVIGFRSKLPWERLGAVPKAGGPPPSGGGGAMRVAHDPSSRSSPLRSSRYTWCCGSLRYRHTSTRRTGSPPTSHPSAAFRM